MLRILYIEDHEDTRELVTLVLEDRNYEVVSHTTIKGALELASNQKFDLYLLDSWLPDGSGIDLCKQLREVNGHTPIVFYSAAAYEVDRDAAMKSGAQAYLIKPSRTSELCEMISKAIADRKESIVA